MKKTITLTFICFAILGFISCNSLSKGKNTSGLYLIIMGGKYGYIDSKGQITITPQFDVAMDFSEDMAVVLIGRGRDSKVGYIDKTGKIVINPQFDMAWPFSEGLAQITVNDKDGYIDKTGKVIINPQFVHSGSFSDGLARVRIGGNRKSSEGQKWGYIDKNGKYVINPQYDFAWDFSEGLALVQTGSAYYDYLNKEGKFPNNNVLHEGGKYSEGYAPAKFSMNGVMKWGYLRSNCVNATYPMFDFAYSFSDGLARVKIEDKYGYIDKGGFHELGAGGGGDLTKMRRTIIDPQFEDAGDFSEGLAAVKVGGLYGYIDKTGKIVINPQFDKAFEFSGGLALVEIAGKRGYIDKIGKYIWNPTN